MNDDANGDVTRVLAAMYCDQCYGEMVMCVATNHDASDVEATVSATMCV